jgi:branched-chain amino acid transport system ATP-binding protein
MDGVDTYYGPSHILHGIDLSLEPGCCLSLMGRNGMGKTTTLKTIMGLVRPGKGKVEIRGHDVSKMPTHAIAASGIAYVPEERGIFPNLTVTENLLMAARLDQSGREDWTFQRVLDLFPRLAEREAQWGNNLSGGEQQMLTIGRALMTNPTVLLLDEATEGLAPLMREEIWRVIRVIKDAGIAVVIVDKNVGRLTELADRHMILVKGRVVFDGGRDELIADPERLHRYLGV